MYRYIALISLRDGVERRSLERVCERTLALPGWSIAFRSGNTVVLDTGRGPTGTVLHLGDNAGIVLGALFSRAERVPSSKPLCIPVDESRRITETAGQHLIGQYWGNYVAVLYHQRRRQTYVLRDPCGGLGCFYGVWEDILFVFSDPSDIAKVVPARFTVDWRYVTAHLLAGHVLGRRTGLKEVSELLGGERLTIGISSLRRDSLWSPRAVYMNGVVDDEPTAAAALRAAVETTVLAWAGRFDRIVHMLSGGLDSSIVASCLAKSARAIDVTCLNFFMGTTADDEPYTVPSLTKQNLARFARVAAHADEREFARLMARRLGYRLLEYERTTAGLDLHRVWDAPLAVAPTYFSGAIDTDEIETRVAEETGAQAFFSGLAGDTVLYASLQPYGAFDYMYEHPLGARALLQILNSSRLSKDSVWHVLTKSIAHGLLRVPLEPSYDVLTRPTLVSKAARTDINREYFDHPWVTDAARLPPGKVRQVEGLVGALFYNYPFRRHRIAPSVNPLCGQLVVEQSLRTSTYTLLAGGVTRGLARVAFADVLPEEIRKRTVKGMGGPFYQRVIRENIDFIRESLLDGVLIQERILDRTQLDAYLRRDQRFMTVTATQIEDYLATEAWVRQWLTHQNSVVAAA